MNSSGRMNTPSPASVSLGTAGNAASNLTFCLPMRIKPVISGNFGEIRYNHFHSGLDFKTRMSIGIPVYAVADGWVSRIRISAYGFGYALYLTHPNGYTTVYGHLDRYAEPISSIAKSEQYKIENSELDKSYKPGEIPVKKGQLIAYSGTSGISMAPHLHFEIRDTKSEDPMDPLLWYSRDIPDHIAPGIQDVTLFAIQNEGTIKGGINRRSVQAIRKSDGIWYLRENLPAVWGKIGFGIRASDRMDNTSNTYGVCQIRLFMDDREIFRQEFSRFSFADTRCVNSLIDYESWQKLRTAVMKSFVEPGNHLKIYGKNESNGYIIIKDESSHNFRYELTDRAGNMSQLKFTIQGQKQQIPVKKEEGKLLKCWEPNFYKAADAEITFPIGSLFKDLHFRYSQKTSSYFSDIYTLQDRFTPLNKSIEASFRIKVDTLSSKNQYYLAKQDPYGVYVYAGGHYVNGFIVASLKDFGNYTVKADKVPPKIIPINVENATKNRLIRINIIDNASGIKSWRGTIDGKWALFEYNFKTSQLKYKFDDKYLTKGKQHKLQLKVTDECGNQSVYEHQFYY